ncbi:MAG: hypothetical protein PHI77_01540 [Candidatus Pacebacteria bacterium]|nr:hypothetical protein [Candidatus Paceibacterota bacterium]MDD4830987.1 hypothetical protein [Candidatus Paceibacterota bacterium]MDD4875067.1 hypothetical protein [Candidatus Paceibacterota bacterium]
MQLKKAFIQTANGFRQFFPVVLGTMLFLSVFIAAFPKEMYTSLFGGNKFLDPFIGAALGSILSGNPVTSYILGGELISKGVSLLAVTAFITAWVTVGIIQLPAESLMLGKKFAITRNIISFLSSIAAAAMALITFSIISV